MPTDAPVIDWMMWAERFGVPVAILVALAFSAWRTGAWLGPKLTGWVEFYLETQRKRADTAEKNSQALSDAVEKTTQLQEENVETNKRFASSLEVIVPIIRKFDQIAFPPRRRK